MLQLRKAVSLESFRLPFRDALEAAAQIGAEAVEINARTMVRPQDLSRTGIRQIRKWLSDYRLQVAVVSYPTRRGLCIADDLERRLDGLKAAMNLANDLGCRVLSSQIGPIPASDDAVSTSTLHDAIGMLAAHSLKAGAWLAMRTGVDGVDEVAGLLQAFPNDAIGIDFDPAELLINGHLPAEFLKRMAARVVNFRARDAVREPGVTRGQEVQLGRGQIDFPSLLALLEEVHYRGYLLVERQSGGAHAKTDSAQALEYLSNLFA